MSEHCPNFAFCQSRRAHGYILDYFCLCHLKRLSPDYQPPNASNPFTDGMKLPSHEGELRRWAGILDPDKIEG